MKRIMCGLLCSASCHGEADVCFIYLFHATSITHLKIRCGLMNKVYFDRKCLFFFHLQYTLILSAKILTDISVDETSC